jgi:hypothetical protein
MSTSFGEEKTYTIGRTILKESDLKIKFTYNDEVFTLHYPNPGEKALIEVDVARRLSGVPRDSVDPEQASLITATCYVSDLYIKDECPEWFKPWECYDEMLIAKLYREYLSFRDKLQNRFSKP